MAGSNLTFCSQFWTEVYESDDNKSVQFLRISRMFWGIEVLFAYQTHNFVLLSIQKSTRSTLVINSQFTINRQLWMYICRYSMALSLCAYIVNISKESLRIPSLSHETLILICFLHKVVRYFLISAGKMFYWLVRYFIFSFPWNFNRKLLQGKIKIYDIKHNIYDWTYHNNNFIALGQSCHSFVFC